MNSEALIIIERPFDGCVVVTLNRPRAMNALSLALRRELVQTFRQFHNDPDIRVVVLTGAGTAFCAGLDLKELGAIANPSASIVPSEEDDPIRAMENYPGPIIGAINGAAITGGFELALACDILIASSAARFADTHVRVGVLPGWGLSQRLSRLIGIQRAKELSFTGNFLSAQRAESWGLVNRVVEPDALLPEALALAKDMLSTDPATLVAYKQLIDDGARLPLGEALRLEKNRSREWATRLDSNSIERRRRQISERGRAQQTGSKRNEH
jgi:enoyl-CoA hydratase